MFDQGTFFASAYTGLADRGNTGLSLGLSIPLGGDVTASSGAASTRAGYAAGASAVKPIREDPGSYGWRLSDLEGAQRLRLASAGYRSDIGKTEATVLQSQSGVAGTFAQEGAIVAAGGDVFFANRIDDAFAVVDAGAPGLEISLENRPAVRTNARGKAILPGLNAYQKNKIAIDPRDLPLDASIAATQQEAVPVYRSGVLVDFGVRTGLKSAIVILTGADGRPLQAGLRGKTAAGQGFAVGYDGRAFIEGLEENNVAIVELPGGQCQAEFAYVPRGDGQTLIGPVVCQ